MPHVRTLANMTSVNPTQVSNYDGHEAYERHMRSLLQEVGGVEEWYGHA